MNANRLTYDTGALIAAERDDRLMWARHRAALSRSLVPTIPAGALAEAWRAGPRPRLSRLLKGCRTEALTEDQDRNRCRSDATSPRWSRTRSTTPTNTATTNAADRPRLPIDQRNRSILARPTGHVEVTKQEAGGSAGLCCDSARLTRMQPDGTETVRPPFASVGYLEAVSIGVGGMVGGGIFAVLGLAVGVGKGGTFIAFLVAGLVALLTAYSYAHLSVALPSEGGTVEFLNQAFGPRRLAGSLNVLLWFSYVITTSLYAFAFGSYGATFLPESAQNPGAHILTSAVIIVMTALNVFSARLITSAEDYIVAAKILILVVFVAVALTDADFAAIKPDTWAGPGSLLAGGMLIFVAYEGFELIANSAADVKNPTTTIPRALYTSVIFTIVLYVLVAIVAVGLLSLTEIAVAEDFALAEAAQVVWGGIGFDLIVVAALLSTASAINATLYGTARLTVVIALDGELPTQLERKICGKPIVGLLLTAAAALVTANFVPLAAISSLASAGFLAIFAAVNIANARLASVTNANRAISIAGAAACISALAALIAHTATTRPTDLVLLGALVLLTYTGEATYLARRQLRPLASDFEPRYHLSASDRRDQTT